MAAEAERQKEIGARIKELRGKVPQQVIADRVGVTLRAYQAWEAGGGIAWGNYERLAEALGVTEEFVLYGPSGKSNPTTQLDRIEAKLNALLRQSGLDPASFEADGSADIEGAAAEARELFADGGEAVAKPPAKPAPSRKRRAS